MSLDTLMSQSSLFDTITQNAFSLENVQVQMKQTASVYIIIITKSTCIIFRYYVLSILEGDDIWLLYLHAMKAICL